MIKVLLAFCLLANAVYGQLVFGSSGRNTATVGSSAVQSNGILVTLAGQGWAYSDDLSLTPATAEQTVTFYSTLKTQTGTAPIGVGIVTTGGTGPKGAACNVITSGSDYLAGIPPNPATDCATDFVSFWTTAPTIANAGAASTAQTTTVTLTKDVPLKWTLTVPSSTGLTTANGCVTTNVVEQKTSGATFNGFAAHSCGSTPHSNSQVATNDNAFTVFAPANTAILKFAVAAVSPATGNTNGATICFQSAAQYAAAAGNCAYSSGSILTGGLAFIGLVATIFLM